jgi:hypothetical protein
VDLPEDQNTGKEAKSASQFFKAFIVLAKYFVIGVWKKKSGEL